MGAEFQIMIPSDTEIDSSLIVAKNKHSTEKRTVVRIARKIEAKSTLPVLLHKAPIGHNLSSSCSCSQCLGSKLPSAPE